MGILSVMYFTCTGSMASTIAVLTTAGANAFIVMPTKGHNYLYRFRFSEDKTGVEDYWAFMTFLY